MIESEEKRERITNTITRWCNHVKATPLLRGGDISGLVQSILGEFYHVHLSCGHMVKELDEGIEYNETEEDGSLISGIECQDCHDERVFDIVDIKINEVTSK